MPSRRRVPRIPPPPPQPVDPTTLQGDAAVDLLDRFRQGEPEAFNGLVESWRPRMVQFFFRLCWDRHRAEDLTQDFFVKLLRSAARYRPEGKLGTFLYRVATNLWIDHYRAQKPRPRLYSLDQPVYQQDGDSPAPGHEQQREAAPGVALESHEEKQMLRRSLEQLTEPHRLVFELAVYQEMPYAEVSRVLEIPVGTVKSRMHNAVRALKEAMATEAAGGPRVDQGVRGDAGFRVARAAGGRGTGGGA